MWSTKALKCMKQEHEMVTYRVAIHEDRLPRDYGNPMTRKEGADWLKWCRRTVLANRERYNMQAIDYSI